MCPLGDVVGVATAAAERWIVGEDASGDAGELVACVLFELSHHDRVARGTGQPYPDGRGMSRAPADARRACGLTVGAFSLLHQDAM